MKIEQEIWVILFSLFFLFYFILLLLFIFYLFIFYLFIFYLFIYLFILLKHAPIQCIKRETTRNRCKTRAL